jgi:phosphoribosylformylglycinamidine synthase subunit PurQ / glutaminase
VTVAVVTFPGSNCDRDCVWAMSVCAAAPVSKAWHKDDTLPIGTTAVLLPGGFSYGDYLRCGAMAARSPIMADVKRFADAGGAVLGICNGFQILCEAGLLPGALLRNHDARFHCKVVGLQVQGNSPLLAGYNRDELIDLPIAHGEGRYHADDATLDELERDNRIAFRYLQRLPSGDAVVNGARRGIAGIVGGRARNIIGLMPHPERRSHEDLGGDDGLPLLQAVAEHGLARGMA